MRSATVLLERYPLLESYALNREPWFQVWVPEDTYVNHQEVVNLLIDLPEEGPFKDSLFALMKVRRPAPP